MNGVFADFVRVKPGSIGKCWVTANLETSWEEALKYMQEMSTEEIANEVSQNNKPHKYSL